MKTRSPAHLLTSGGAAEADPLGPPGGCLSRDTRRPFL